MVASAAACAAVSCGAIACSVAASANGSFASVDERARVLAGARVALAQRRQRDGPGGGDALVELAALLRPPERGRARFGVERHAGQAQDRVAARDPRRDRFGDGDELPLDERAQRFRRRLTLVLARRQRAEQQPRLAVEPLQRHRLERRRQPRGRSAPAIGERERAPRARLAARRQHQP
jgi:hypothetical protein